MECKLLINDLVVRNIIILVINTRECDLMSGII
jgi:hypothetical protein